MSIWSFQQAVVKSDLGPTTKLVLLVLDCHVNAMGDPAFPSYATLCERTSLKRSAVMAHVKLAESLGWLRREHRKNKDGTNQTNLFHLRVPSVPTMASNPGEIEGLQAAETDLFGDAGGPPNELRGVHQTNPLVHQMDPYSPPDGPRINQGNKPVKKEKGASAKHELPADFCVTDEHRAWAKSKGLPSPDDHIEAFRDYHTAKNSKWADWDAVLRTWMRNTVKFSRSSTISGIAKPTKRKLSEMDYHRGVSENGRLL